MGEVEKTASRDCNAFCLNMGFPDVRCRFADNSQEQLKLTYGLHFALTMYMRGKAHGSGKDMYQLRGQFLRAWELLQKKYGLLVNSGQVQQLAL